MLVDLFYFSKYRNSVLSIYILIQMEFNFAAIFAHSKIVDTENHILLLLQTFNKTAWHANAEYAHCEYSTLCMHFLTFSMQMTNIRLDMWRGKNFFIKLLHLTLHLTGFWWQLSHVTAMNIFALNSLKMRTLREYVNVTLYISTALFGVNHYKWFWNVLSVETCLLNIRQSWCN